MAPASPSIAGRRAWMHGSTQICLGRIDDDAVWLVIGHQRGAVSRRLQTPFRFMLYMYRTDDD